MRTTALLIAVAIGALAIPHAPAQEPVRNLAPIAGTAQRSAMSSVVPIQKTASIPHPKAPAERWPAVSNAKQDHPLNSIERAELAATVAAVGTISATTATKPRVVSLPKKAAKKPAKRKLELPAAAIAEAGDPSVLKRFTFSSLD